MANNRKLSLTQMTELREPSFVQLRIFHATMITRSVSRAAKLLGITQPAASKMLRLLEAETQLVLFERANQRLIPTPEALLLQESVELLYGTYGAVQRLIDSLRSPDRGNVTIAAIPTQASGFLPKAVKMLRQSHPQISVTIDTLANQPVIDRVQSGQADFGLVHDVTSSPDTLNEDIGNQHVVCIAPAGHRFEALPHVTPEDLRGEVFLSYGPDTSFGNFIEEALSSANVRLGVDVVVTSSSTLIALIAEGLGVGLIEPAALLPFANNNNLVVSSFSPPLVLRSRVIRSRVRPLTRHAELLLDAYRSVVLAS